MSKGTIIDSRIKLRPNKALLKLLEEHKDSIHEIPENVAKALKMQGYSVATKVEILKEDSVVTGAQKINIKLINNITNSETNKTSTEVNLKNTSTDDDDTATTDDENCTYLHLSDIKWLNSLLIKLRKEQKTTIFLHEIIDKCELKLPENEILARNPELEARCQKLREEQQNLDYRKMTKNVDSVLKNYPEDTIAYQMKALNSQLIAVLQFVVSVAAGFAFGFLGVQLIVGNLEFGFRLLLGIICALVIALAEIYFLAKKLLEYDDIAVAAKKLNITPKKKKDHID